MGALRERNFRLLFFGQSVSALGNSLVPVALVFATLALTRSPADLGYVLGTEAAAQVVFLLAGGVIADRLPGCRTGSRRSGRKCAGCAGSEAEETTKRPGQPRFVLQGASPRP